MTKIHGILVVVLATFCSNSSPSYAFSPIARRHGASVVRPRLSTSLALSSGPPGKGPPPSSIPPIPSSSPSQAPFGGPPQQRRGGPPPAPPGGGPLRDPRLMDKPYVAPVKVEGNTLRTWSFAQAKQVRVDMTTTGRPLNANVELWHGPDYTPAKMRVYVEDGNLRPCTLIMTTKGGGSDSVAVRNIAHGEFPLTALVQSDDENYPVGAELIEKGTGGVICQGAGAVRTFNFEADVESVRVFLRAPDIRNIKARIELLQGPNNVKQMFEYYASNGTKNPFCAIIETPGTGNVVRITNQNTVEFPFVAYVEPFGP